MRYINRRFTHLLTYKGSQQQGAENDMPKASSGEWGDGTYH